MEIHKQTGEDSRGTLIDTGEHTATGGRLERIRAYLDETFLFTYGDGFADIDILALILFTIPHTS